MLFAFEETRRHLRLRQVRVPTALAGRLSRLRGVDFGESSITFDRGLYAGERGKLQATYVAAAALGEPTRIGQRHTALAARRNETTNADLEAINRFTAEDLAADDVFVFERYVINDQPSRSIGLVFTTRALEKMAGDFSGGRSRLLYHDRGDVVGATFSAEVVEETVNGLKASWVRTREYMLRGGRHAGVIEDVRGGVLRYDSVGLRLGSAIEFIDIEDSSFIRIDYDEDEQGPLEAEEVSFVYLGEMRGTGQRNAFASMEVPALPALPEPQLETQQEYILCSL